MGGLLTPAAAKSDVSKSKAENKTSWERPVAEDSDDGNECRRSLTEDGGDAEEDGTWFEGLGGSRPRKESAINKSESFTVPGSLEDTLREQNTNREKERQVLIFRKRIRSFVNEDSITTQKQRSGRPSQDGRQESRGRH